jgi:hypothetical protein
MGRPLNKKYFANTNYKKFGTANVGGESVASVTISGSWANFADATTTVVFGDPDLVGGVRATGTATIVAGAVTAVVMTNLGSGYLSAPTVTIADSDGGAETTGSATAVLTANGSARLNSIKCEAQIGSGSEVTTGDIIKQESSRRYKVQTGDGTAVCKLVTTASLNANEMSIVATDSDSGTYFVKKLTAHKVTLVPIDGTQFTSGQTAKWSFTTTSAGSQVTIANQ